MVVIIKVLNPNLSDLERTTLSANVSSGTTITVDSNQGLAVSDYIVIGNLQTDNTELRKISTISGLTITVDSALTTSHIAGEYVRKTSYNQVQIYRASSQAGTYSLLTTIGLDFSNQNGETVYIDNTGASTDYYKTKYYNATTLVTSSFSTAVKGGGLSTYITKENFRLRTGISTSDLNDSILDTFLQRATQQIRDKCYILRRREFMSSSTDSEGTKRYYFTHGYLADDNLDSTIDKNDLEVLEMNSDGTVENDITAQVDSIDQYNAYFTLNDGYPSDDSYNVFCTYRWTRYPIAEVTDDLEELCESLAMTYYVKRTITDSYKRGIKNISVPGLSISREADAFKDMLEYYDKNSQRLINKLQPIKFVSWEGNTALTQYPNAQGQPLKRDMLNSFENLDARIDRYRRR